MMCRRAESDNLHPTVAATEFSKSENSYANVDNVSDVQLRLRYSWLARSSVACSSGDRLLLPCVFILSRMRSTSASRFSVGGS